MSGWWYVALAAALAVGAALYLRARRAGPGRRRVPMERADDRPAGPRAGFTAERERARVAGMSEADRAWEAASLERDREARARSDDPAGPRA